MKHKEDVYEMLSGLVDYDQETGVFIWKNPSFNRKGSGVAGFTDSLGYIRIQNGKRYIAAHRLAFFIVHGRVPHEVDHINQNKRDNRICNIREATRTENMRNRPIFSNNKSGVTGVVWEKDRSKWCAIICLHGKSIRLGSFDKKEDAIASRKEAERRHFGDFAPSSQTLR